MNDQYKAALEEIFTEIDALRLERLPVDAMRLMGGWTAVIKQMYRLRDVTRSINGVVEPMPLNPYDCEALRERLQMACQARLLTEGKLPQ